MVSIPVLAWRCRTVSAGRASGTVLKAAKPGAGTGPHSTPEILKAPRRELGVPHGRLNAAMAEIGLQRARVGALVRQGKAGAVPQHVRVDLEGQLGLDTCTFDQFGKSRGRERCLPLGHKHKRRRGLALECAQGP